MVEFLKKLNILLVSRDKEHCQQRRMVIPEDKEWERKRGCSEGAHLCAITLRSSGWSWGLASGNWTTSHYTKGPSPSSLPFGVTWNWPHQCLVRDMIRNVTLDILHTTRPYFLDFYKTSRESCLRCTLQHVSDIQILIRRQILVNYKALWKSAQRFKMCYLQTDSQADKQICRR